LSNSPLHSIISIYGTVRTRVDRRCPDDTDPNERCECRFALENEDGRFSVQALIPPAGCDQLPASRVQVIGTLHSTFFRRCHQHHQVIEAFLVIILGRTKSGRSKVLAVLPGERDAGPELAQWLDQLIMKP
jgi:Tfp pilus assembly ATPase PilU